MGKVLSGELSCPCDRSCYVFFRFHIKRVSQDIIPCFHIRLDIQDGGHVLIASTCPATQKLPAGQLTCVLMASTCTAMQNCPAGQLYPQILTGAVYDVQQKTIYHNKCPFTNKRHLPLLQEYCYFNLHEFLFASLDDVAV